MLDETTIQALPESSGVYLFRDREGKILYIGKARNLRDRVRSYARAGLKDLKTERLVEKIAAVDTILTANESEAFLLESNLIKEHTPRYNINLKDDKTYVSLRLTVKDRFPALFITRDIKDDGSLYFGPYPHARDVRDVIKTAQALYPLRRCRDTVFRRRKRPCMLFQVGKCLGPCGGEVEEGAYRAVVAELIDFLSGRDEKLLKDLESRIREAASTWNFEEARKLKERYLAIKTMLERQHVHEHHGRNRDVWAFLEDEKGMRIVLLGFRRGVLMEKRVFKEPLVAVAPGDAVSSFLFQYYSGRPAPEEIIISEETGERPFLEHYLKEQNRKPVRIHGPGHKGAQEMIALAVENLHSAEPVALGPDFRRLLHLRKEPVRVEIYDISHTRGKNPSGAMVVFQDFKPHKTGYRVFHIRDAAPMDDTAMMAEVLRRRLSDERLGPHPDLLILDGGKGQLSAASAVLTRLGLTTDMIAIAKGEGRKRMTEVIYLPLRKNPLRLPQSSPVFKKIVEMRDEAHRFAVASHKKWKRKEDLR